MLSNANVLSLYRAARVTRYHAMPPLNLSCQNNADHTWGVVMIILAFHPAPSPDLIRAAMFHDLGEIEVGDLPGNLKLQPKAKAMLGHHETLEFDALNSLGITGENCAMNLSDEDMNWLKFADQLEALLFILFSGVDLDLLPNAQDYSLNLTRLSNKIAPWLVTAVGQQINPVLKKRGLPTIMNINREDQVVLGGGKK